MMINMWENHYIFWYLTHKKATSPGEHILGRIDYSKYTSQLLDPWLGQDGEWNQSNSSCFFRTAKLLWLPGGPCRWRLGGDEIRALRKNLGKDAGDLVEGSLRGAGCGRLPLGCLGCLGCLGGNCNGQVLVCGHSGHTASEMVWEHSGLGVGKGRTGAQLGRNVFFFLLAQTGTSQKVMPTLVQEETLTFSTIWETWLLNPQTFFIGDSIQGLSPEVGRYATCSSCSGHLAVLRWQTWIKRPLRTWAAKLARLVLRGSVRHPRWMKMGDDKPPVKWQVSLGK